MFAMTLSELTFALDLTVTGPLLSKAGEESGAFADIGAALGLPPIKQINYFGDRKKREQELRNRLKKETQERRQRQREERRGARAEGGVAPVAAVDEPDMRFVRTQRNGQSEPYLPGSSLKGVLRSQAERLARSMTVAGNGACNPFAAVTDAADPPCWQRFGDPEETEHPTRAGAEVYHVACAACRLFGNPYLASRLRISDAYLRQALGKQPLPRRDGVGIDRQRGAAADTAKYDFEFLDEGVLRARVRLVNFELWQVGLLAHLIHALGQEEMPIGYGTRRGLGCVRGSVAEMRVSYVGRAALTHAGPRLTLQGIGTLLPGAETAAAYGLRPEAAVEFADGVRLETLGDGPMLRRTWVIEDSQMLWAQTGPLWSPELVAELQLMRQEDGQHG